MELHKAIREIVDSKGADMMKDPKIINYLLDYQAFKEKPATKQILRDIISLGYVGKVTSINPQDSEWQDRFKKYQCEFIDSCGYKEDLVYYVFESIVYALGWKNSIKNQYDDIIPDDEEKKESTVIDIGRLNIIEIMNLARNGNVDAVLYCSQHQIDPFNCDSDFYFDYNNVSIGDWFYEDGSYSHRRSDIKKCVGVVFSLSTSPLEYADGWTHGLIVAIKGVRERIWGESGELSYPHTHYNYLDMENLEKAPDMFNDYQTEYLLRDSKINAFEAARNCKLPLPDKTSGWFLPSITQLKQIVCNLPCEIITSISLSNKQLFWSSSQANADESCYIYIDNWGNKVSYSFGTSDKKFPRKIRPIAAF